MPKETELPPKLTTKGRCEACGGEYSKAGMSRHLASCPARQVQQGLPTVGPRQKVEQGRLLHLLIEGQDDPIYWLHLEVPGVVTLLDLDKYLREHWLECCGHLSAYEIEGVRYAVMPDQEFGLDEKSMRGVKLEKVLAEGLTAHYEYDYGTTTDLALKVVGLREGRNCLYLPKRRDCPPSHAHQCRRSILQL